VASDEGTRRELHEAFVDAFLLDDVPPIRAQMPFNIADPETNLMAAMRVDSLAAVARGGPYESQQAMMRGFYANQETFNNDPARNQIVMSGRIAESIGTDGSIVARIDITYRLLPLTIYRLDTWRNALERFDPQSMVAVLADGALDAELRLAMTLPSRRAPLHFWRSSAAKGIREFDFVANGSGWLLDERGGRIRRARVYVEAGRSETDIVRLTPLD
jgi:hypothetical protein